MLNAQEHLKAIVKNYRPIEELIPAHWSEGDIFVIPPWRWHQHENSLSSDAVLFSIDDAPAMTKLGFYRKQEATA